MKKIQLLALAGLIGASAASAAVVTAGNSTATPPWLGFMNVFNLPADGGGYQFGSPWGLGDLVAQFNDPTNELTLKVNSIGDANPYWYIGGGGPGAAGNKIMEANLYHEATDVYNGQNVVFKGSVVSNDLSATHSATMFIKDFAPDYSSFNLTQVALPTSGSFSISLATDPSPGRHVQWGFSVYGPCVWITDADLFGKVVLSTLTCLSDFDGDTFVTGDDFDAYVAAFEAGNDSADFDGDTFVTGDDFDAYVAAFDRAALPAGRPSSSRRRARPVSWAIRPLAIDFGGSGIDEAPLTRLRSSLRVLLIVLAPFITQRMLVASPSRTRRAAGEGEYPAVHRRQDYQL